MHTAIGIPQQTCGSEALVLVLAVLTLGIDGFTVLEQTGRLDSAAAQLHGRVQRNHLEGRTGSVGCVESTVKEGVKVRFQNLVIILVIGLGIVGGIGSAGQDLAGLDLHDHDRRAFHVSAGLFLILFLFGILRILQPVDNVRQRVLRNDLQIDVDGGFHVVACLRFLAFVIFLRNNSAVLIDRISAQAVDTVQISFKCRLEAGLADLGVHVVFLTLTVLVGLVHLLPLRIGHGAHGAQNVGRIGGVVLTDGGRLDHQAGGVQLQQCGQMLVGNVFHKDIAGQVDDAAEVKFITQTDNRTGIGIGPFFRNLVTLAHSLHQQRRCDVRVDAAVLQVFLEIALPCGRILRQGIFKGTILGDGEMVHVGDAQFPGLFDQLHQGFVGVIIRGDNVVVEHKVITGSVTDQNITIAVQNVTAGRFNTGLGDVNVRIVRLAVGFDDLQVEQTDAVQRQNRRKDQHQRNGTNFT